MVPPPSILQWNGSGLTNKIERITIFPVLAISKCLLHPGVRFQPLYSIPKWCIILRSITQCFIICAQMLWQSPKNVLPSLHRRCSVCYLHCSMTRFFSYHHLCLCPPHGHFDAMKLCALCQCFPSSLITHGGFNEHNPSWALPILIPVVLHWLLQLAPWISLWWTKPDPDTWVIS